MEFDTKDPVLFHFVSSISRLHFFLHELRHLLKQQLESLTCVSTNFILYHIILFYSLTYFILVYFISLIIFLYDYIYFILFHFILYHPLVVFLLLMNCGMYTNRKWNYEHVFILPCWGKIYFLWFKMITLFILFYFISSYFILFY